MSLRPITLASIVHFAASIIIWFGMIGVVLGLGFKDDWSAYDYFYAYSVETLFYVMCFPAWWIGGADQSVVDLWILPVQLFSSFIQANIVLAGWKMIAKRNK